LASGAPASMKVPVISEDMLRAARRRRRPDVTGDLMSFVRQGCRLHTTIKGRGRRRICQRSLQNQSWLRSVWREAPSSSLAARSKTAKHNTSSSWRAA
jgi:hypothetical protein